jgi:heparanase 1
MVNRTIREHDATVQIFGGEIGPHNDGSPVCDHTSMRWANFGTSLWYSDALAAKALHGYSGFCRQDYIGGDYGMLDCSTGAPLPDYYTALAFTTVMGQRVLGARVAGLGVAGAGGGAALGGAASSVRTYAHCAAPAAAAGKAGAVAVLVINLSQNSTTVSFADGAVVTTEYVLSPSADPKSSLIDATGLLGTGVELNGELLALGANGAVPAIEGKAVGSAHATVPATSIAFLVLADAEHPACM